MRKNPGFKIILGLLFPPTIAHLEFKTKEELELMPQTEEEAQDRDDSDSNSSRYGNFMTFGITQILREINFVDSRSAKTGAFAILGAVNFVHLVNFYLQKVQKFIKIQILSL